MEQGNAMKGMIGREAWKLVIFAIFLGLLPALNVGAVRAAGETMSDYTKLPAFLETGLKPNLLLLIDNSASMYDPAYLDPVVEELDAQGDPTGKTLSGGIDFCFADDYDNAVAYAGYFSPLAEIWYRYVDSPFCSNDTYANESDCTANSGTWNDADDQFIQLSKSEAETFCSDETGIEYASDDLCITVNSGTDPDTVTAFAAKGRFLNWLAASKFDVEKEILSGGKYHQTNNELIMETRGCMGKRFVKSEEVYLNGDSTTTPYYSTFAIRPPDDGSDGTDEITDDQAYNGSSHNTRIEIYKVSLTGFDADSCNTVISEFTESRPELGSITSVIDTCLGPETPEESVVLNHVTQECWYYNVFGVFQSGEGSVTSLKGKCEDIYNASSGDKPPPDDYQSPAELSAGELCYGEYDSSHSAGGEPWGSGYMGQCWEEQYARWDDNPCVGDGTNVSAATAIQDANEFWYYCADNDSDSVDEYIRCGKNQRHSCQASDWTVWQTPVSADPSGVPAEVYWTNDEVVAGSETTAKQGNTCAQYALESFCTELDQQTTVDPSDGIKGSNSGAKIPATLVDYAVSGQLGDPLKTLKGRVVPPQEPVGLINEFKYNLRMGAMVFNDGTATECASVEDRPGSGRYVASLYGCMEVDHTNGAILSNPPKKDGGRIIAYIDEGDGHIDSLVEAINDVNADTWTPTAEAMYNAIGYFTQDSTNDLRINPPTGDPALGFGGDFIRDSDWGLNFGASDMNAWAIGTPYAKGDIVYTAANKMGYTKLYRAKNAGTSAYCADCSYIEEDSGVKWMPYDPVQAGCQSNNVLLITDGASTADIHGNGIASGMTDFVTAGNDDSDLAATWIATETEPTDYECMSWIDKTGASNTDGVFDFGEPIVHKNYGSTLLDDLTYYGHSGSTIYSHSAIGGVDKEPIKTHIVAAGTLRNDAPGLECNSRTILNSAADNGGTTLVEAADPTDLEEKLRDVFEAIGGEVSSGSAASVISHSRSGDGAIYQAIFYPKQVDAQMNEVDWTGDVHALWLDAHGNIREDCGATDCTGTTGDKTMNPRVDRIVTFYTDATGSAMARLFSDANGDGSYDNSASCSDPTYTNEDDCEDNFKVWSYADNPDFVDDGVLLKDLLYIWSAADWLADASPGQRAYDSVASERYIFTMLPDASGNPDMVAFTTSALGPPSGAFTADEYDGYLNAFSSLDSDINRTADGIVNYVRGLDQTGYRSRQIDWTPSTGLETVKLGDIIHSTPTLVGSPAENYDVIYGDPTYRNFRKKYQNRRAVIYAGGNDGGMHAFNGGYYDRHNKRFLKAPPVPGSDPVVYETQYDLAAELWMYVPKNILPHLRWLTDHNYGDGHVYYVDGKPYIFDGKIFSEEAACTDADLTNDDQCLHPGGWGTVLVGGMRFGGGNIGVDIDGAGDDEIIRSAYFILDITNPEYPPVVLAEFTDEDLGYTIGSPTAIPMLRCDKNTVAGLGDCNTKNWPMDWYLAFGSGPHSDDPVPAGPQEGMRGVSDQNAKLYVMRLGGTNTSGLTPASLGHLGSGQVASGVVSFSNQPILVSVNGVTSGQCSDPAHTTEADCLGAAEIWISDPFTPGACSDFTSADEAACLAAGKVWNPVSCKGIPGVWDTYSSFNCVGSGPGRYWDHWWGLNTGRGCYERTSTEECLARSGWWVPGNNASGICSDTRDTSKSECLRFYGTWKNTYPNSFFGDFIAVDYDLDFKTDTLYFGSVLDTRSWAGHEAHGGALHRLVSGDNPDPATWSFNLFSNVGSPVAAAPSVASDGQRAWVYFGTGRYYSAEEDKAIATPFQPTRFLGLKERYGDDGNMDLTLPNGGNLVDVTATWVKPGGELVSPPPSITGVGTFDELNVKISELDTDTTNDDKDIYHGWKINLAGRERVIGQPAILGDIVTFTSYIPSDDPCEPDGTSYLWAVYYRTGTAYHKSVIGTKVRTEGTEVLRKVGLGSGLSTTPNIHAGAGDGTKAFVQSSTGAILSIEQTNPGVVKSGMRSWRELSGKGSSCN